MNFSLRTFLAFFCFSSLFTILCGFTSLDCFDKRHNQTNIHPYLHNGQINPTELNAQNTTSTMVSFYKGQSYRISPSSEVQSNVYFELVDPETKTLLYTSKDQKHPHLDVRFESSRILQVDLKSNDNNKDVCATLHVGFLPNE